MNKFITTLLLPAVVLASTTQGFSLQRSQSGDEKMASRSRSERKDALNERRSSRRKGRSNVSDSSNGIEGGTLEASPPLVTPQIVTQLEVGAGFHVDQQTILSYLQQGLTDEIRDTVFEEGDELFEISFNALDGAGANVGQSLRFSRVPRADLKGDAEWSNHIPMRMTGPNAASCSECHHTPPTGSGSISNVVISDPLHTGDLSKMVRRDTTHVMGSGALQMLAQEMTTDLQALKDQLSATAVAQGGEAEVVLTSKGVEFGSLKAVSSDGVNVEFDFSQVEGVDEDLIVKPFGWQGTHKTLRNFVRLAMHNELGMQPIELVGEGVDGDFDGVTNESTVGDVTAIDLYMAGQPRPVTQVELGTYGVEDPVTAEEVAQINRGETVFAEIGCASCHVPEMQLNNPLYQIPSNHPSYRDNILPSGQLPLAVGLTPDNPVTFDLTKDHPDNILEFNGETIRMGSFPTQADGSGAVISLYGDLKRHDMGSDLADPVDAKGVGESVFMTENLWGCGSTAPYMHDGRASTLTEAIIAHGGEGAESREAFIALGTEDQAAVISFLNNLVLHKPEEEE